MKYIISLVTVLTIVTSNLSAQDRVLIPGTKVSMVAPNGFTASKTFQGFQDVNTNSSIMVIEMPGPFAEISAGMTSDNLKKVGVMLKSKRDTVHQGYKALIIEGSQSAQGITFKKVMLLFGNASKTVMINSAFPSDHPELALPVLNSALSANYNERQQVNLEDAVSFTIDTSGTGFKPDNVINGALGFSLKGTSEKSYPKFLAARSIGKTIINDQKAFCEQRLRKLPGYASHKIVKNNPVTIDGLKGYQLTATGNESDGKKDMILLTVLFLPENNGYYLMTGMTNADNDKNIGRFKRLSESFKVKD